MMDYVWGVGGLAVLALLAWGAARLLRVRQGSEDRRYFGDTSDMADGDDRPF
jgi:hypothetical protein